MRETCCRLASLSFLFSWAAGENDGREGGQVIPFSDSRSQFDFPHELSEENPGKKTELQSEGRRQKWDNSRHAYLHLGHRLRERAFLLLPYTGRRPSRNLHVISLSDTACHGRGGEGEFVWLNKSRRGSAEAIMSSQIAPITVNRLRIASYGWNFKSWFVYSQSLTDNCTTSHKCYLHLQWRRHGLMT